MTAEDIVVLAMARTSEITDAYPATRSLAYRRLGLRQRQLQALAARENPDYYGVCAETPLVNLAADLNDIATPVPMPELIQKVTIEDHGTSTWTNGKVISIVPLSDLNAELPPRMTLRDLVLQSVGNDLLNVTSIMVFYSRLADVFAPTDGGAVVELQDPFNELLVLDLVKVFLAKATRLDATIRQTSIETFAAEEASLLTAYLDHVRTYGPYSTRFGVARETSARPVAE